MTRRKKMTLTIFGIVCIAIAVGAVVWYFAAGFARACNPPLPRQTITIGATGGVATTFDVEMATTMVEQSCGLSGRTGLGDNEGMLFVFGTPNTQTFWMKDMQFALDMIWISDNKVVGMTQNIPPPAPGTPLWRLNLYGSPPFVDKVLEVNAGAAAKDNIQVGDIVGGV